MWTSGSAGYGKDLIDFYNREVEQGRVLQVRNMSKIEIGSIKRL